LDTLEEAEEEIEVLESSVQKLEESGDQVSSQTKSLIQGTEIEALEEEVVEQKLEELFANNPDFLNKLKSFIETRKKLIQDNLEKLKS